MQLKNIFLPYFALALLASCGPPVESDAINREKNNNDIKAMTQVTKTSTTGSGYSGFLVSKKTGRNLGYLSLHLYPDTESYTGPSDIRSQQRTVLRGWMELQLAEKKLAFKFNKSDFDYKSGNAFSVGFDPALADSRSGIIGRDSFALKATVVGDTATGEVFADSYVDDGAKFTLILNAPEPDVRHVLEDASIKNPLVHVEKLYKSQGSASGSKEFLVSARSTSDEEEFMRLLLPFQYVNVTYFYVPGDSSVSMVFKYAQWNMKTGRLTAHREQAAYSNGIATGGIVMQDLECCIEGGRGNGKGRLQLPDDLDCSYTISNKTTNEKRGTEFFKLRSVL